MTADEMAADTDPLFDDLPAGPAPLWESAVHPAADLFPRLVGAEFAAFTADIAEHGLREPVWTWDDPDRGLVLLDGRNRVAACRQAGVTVQSREYEGTDPLAFVISANLARRHLDTGQRAMLAVEIEKLRGVEAAERQRTHGGTAPGRPKEQPPSSKTLGADLHQVSDQPTQAKRAPRAADEAAAIAGVSGRAVAQAKRITQQAPDLAAKVAAGQMALDRAEKVVKQRAEPAEKAVVPYAEYRKNFSLAVLSMFQRLSPFEAADAAARISPAEVHLLDDQIKHIVEYQHALKRARIRSVPGRE